MGPLSHADAVMWFRKKDKDTPAPFAGTARALDGLGALIDTETAVSDALVVEAAPVPGGRARAAAGRDTIVRVLPGVEETGGAVQGYAAGGLRTAAIVQGGDEHVLRATAQRRLPAVFHAIGRRGHSAGPGLRGGHDDYHAADGSGAFLMFAASAQEVADFALIAHRVAERALTPGLVAQDLYSTSHSVQHVLTPEAGLVERFVGGAGDAIDAPSPAQAMVFGARRRRVPRFVDLDHPAGIGAALDAVAQPRALAARRTFFGDDVARVADEAMQEFGELTGRRYRPISTYRTDDAEVVFVAQGAVLDALRAVADHLRRTKKLKVGVIGVTMLRPFDAAALTSALAGKKGVTVLDRTDDPLSEDAPLAALVRAALERVPDRPPVFSGRFAGSDLPWFGELCAAALNMAPDGGARREFFLGLGARTDRRRFPHLQALEQRLERDYPALDERTLPAADAAPLGPTGSVVRIESLSSQGAMAAGNLLATVLSDDAGWRLRTFARGGLEPGLTPVRLSIYHGGDDLDDRALPEAANTLLVTSAVDVAGLAGDPAIGTGTGILVGTPETPEAVWHRLPARTSRWLRDRGVQIACVDARAIAEEAATRPAFSDQLIVWCLLGAWLGHVPAQSRPDIEMVSKRIAEALATRARVPGVIAEEVRKAFVQGAQTPVAYTHAPDDLAPVDAEPAAPWTARDAADPDAGAFDPARFWHSVGYFYESGQARETLSDPYLAAGIVPARVSAFRDVSPLRLEIPEWLPENCTGCGDCWSACPDSALPATVRSIAALVDTAFAAAESSGGSMIQLGRIKGHLAKQAHKLFGGDGTGRYRTASVLLDDAFEQLVAKLDLSDEDRVALEGEFTRVRDAIGAFPLARTEAFFEAPETAAKGTGEVLAITLNPDACKGCGLCIEVCPENAFEWRDDEVAHSEALRPPWRFHMSLPRDENTRVVAGDPATENRRLLDWQAAHTLVGGDSAFPGTGARIAARLVTGAVESVMRPRHDAHAKALDELIAQLEAHVQGRVSESVHINNFEDFGRRLARVSEGKLSADDLAEMAGSDEATPDTESLQRMTDLVTRLHRQRDTYASGERARMLLSIDGDGVAPWSGSYPYNPYAAPWIAGSGGALATVSAALEGVTQQLAEEVADCRAARAIIEGRFQAGEDDAIPRWEALTAAERALAPAAVALVSDDAVAWEALERVLGGSLPVKVALVTHRIPGLDSTGAATTTLAIAGSDAGVLQSTVAHPGHLMGGVVEMIEDDGPALVSVYAPDTVRDGVAPERVIEQARVACDARAFPLIRRVAGEMDLGENPAPDADRAVRHFEFSTPSGAPEKADVPVTAADCAVGLVRYREHFKFLSAGHVTEAVQPLWEMLDREPDTRTDAEPYITIAGAGGRRAIAVVSDEMVAASERVAAAWERLRAMATPPGPAETEAPAAPAPEAAPVAPAPDTSAHEKLTEQLLWLSGYGRDPEFFQRSLREFIVGVREQERDGNGGEPSDAEA